MIGPSIIIKGEVNGEEDCLVIDQFEADDYLTVCAVSALDRPSCVYIKSTLVYSACVVVLPEPGRDTKHCDF